MKSPLARYGLAGALVWLYLYSFPYFPEIRSANELPRVYLTVAIADHGTFAIDSGIARWGATADVSRARGRAYSNKAPGSSFLAVPAYAALAAIERARGHQPSLAQIMWVSRVFAGVLPALLFLALMARFLSRFTRSDDARRLAIVGYGLGSMAMVYSVLFIAHQLSAACIGTAYILSVWVIEDGRDRRLLFAAGLAAGCAPLVDYQAAFAGVPLAAYLAWHLVLYPRPAPGPGRAPLPRAVGAGRPPARRRYVDLALCAAGAAGPVALLLWYHHAAFGSPFATGYDHSQTFAHFHQKGFLGLTELRWEALSSSLVAPDNGLLVFCPALLLAVPGWVILARRRQYDHLLVTASVAVIYLLFISAINFWRGGWQIGPRYITAMLPFVLVPVTVALDAACRRGPLRAAAVALVAVGVVVYATACAEFPYFPERFRNPLYEVTFRLIGDGLAPYNLGWIAGLRGPASLLPFGAALAAVLFWCAVPRRALWRSGLAGLACAAAIVIAYHGFPRGGPPAERAYQWITTVMPGR